MRKRRNVTERPKQDVEANQPIDRTSIRWWFGDIFDELRVSSIVDCCELLKSALIAKEGRSSTFGDEPIFDKLRVSSNADLCELLKSALIAKDGKSSTFGDEPIFDKLRVSSNVDRRGFLKSVL